LLEQSDGRRVGFKVNSNSQYSSHSYTSCSIHGVPPSVSHLSGSHWYPLVLLCHCWDDHGHLARTLEPQHIRILGGGRRGYRFQLVTSESILQTLSFTEAIFSWFGSRSLNDVGVVEVYISAKCANWGSRKTLNYTTSEIVSGAISV